MFSTLGVSSIQGRTCIANLHALASLSTEDMTNTSAIGCRLSFLSLSFRLKLLLSMGTPPPLTFLTAPGRLHPDEDFIPPMDPIIKNWVIPKRPSFGTKGAAAKVAVNAYPVIRFPSAKIHQYDVGCPSCFVSLAIVY